MNCKRPVAVIALLALLSHLPKQEVLAQGRGYHQANSMGAGPAPVPETGVFRVFLLAGQSNMTGHGWSRELGPPYNQRHDRIRLWANGRWEYFVPKNNFGPGVAMAHQLSEYWPEDSIGIIKVAIGGTGILSFQPDWTKESANRTLDGHKGNLYRDIINAVSSARQVSEFDLTGLIWKQGGKDMRSKQLGEEYLFNFEKMITHLRADLGTPELPAFIATYVTRQEFEQYNAPFKLTRPGMAAVLKAHLDAAETIPHVVTFSHGNLPCRIDGVHFNTEGQLKLGKMYARAVQEYYSIQTPDETESQSAGNADSD